MSATGKNYVVDDFTTVYSTAIMAPGTVVESEGFEYRFIQNGDTDTATAGTPLILESTSEWKGCYDISDGLYYGGFLGVAMADMETGEYGFVMKEGVYNTCTALNAIALGAEICAGNTDGGFRAATSAEVQAPAGVCLEAQTQAATGMSIYVKGL